MIDALKSGAPRFSVVIPTCDRKAKTLACVQSLLVQTIEDIEVIVVDDGSRDGTADAVEALGDPRVKVMRNERNLGANASRNRGSQAATADLVGFLDSDCVTFPDWVECFLPIFEDPLVGASSGLVIDACRDNPWELMFAGVGLFARPGDISRFISCNLCVRRELLAAFEWEEDFTDNAVTGDGQVDTTFSGRCDEEGLYLAIRAAGWRVVAAPAARVEHHHGYNARSLMKQAFHGGQAAAELVWKYHLRFPVDIFPLFLAYLLLVPAVVLGGVFSWWFLLVPALFLALEAAGAVYKELSRKGKRLGELLRIGHVLPIYYHLRLAGYLVRRVKLGLQRDGIERINPDSIGRELPSPPLPSA